MDIEELKIRLKRNRLVYSANAALKSFFMKRGVRNLKHRYEKRIAANGIRYQEAEAVAEFKARHAALVPDFEPKRVGDLNIFWVGASQAQDESGFLQALNRLGEVTSFHNSKGEYGPHYEIAGSSWLEVRQVNDASLIEQVAQANQKRKVDCLIGQMWSHIFSEEALLQIRNLGIPVINIAMDDRLPNLWGRQDGHRMGSVGLASSIDITLTTAPEACEWYAAENMPAVFWPLASDETLFAPEKGATKDIDILFVGNRYGIRGSLVQYLEKNGLSVTCYGGGWPNGYVDAERNIDLSKRAKIILGVGTIGHCSDLYTLKLRDFDALMTGALYITHRNPDLLQIFNEGEHLECYENAGELLRKLRYYLAHPDEAEKIGLKSTGLSRQKHSWYYRLVTTFTRLELVT